MKQKSLRNFEHSWEEYIKFMTANLEKKTPRITTFRNAGVVLRESVRIALTYAALNSIDVCAADIRNAYLKAPSSEKYYIPRCGLEFGLENVG